MTDVELGLFLLNQLAYCFFKRVGCSVTEVFVGDVFVASLWTQSRDKLIPGQIQTTVHAPVGKLITFLIIPINTHWLMEINMDPETGTLQLNQIQIYCKRNLLP